MRQLSGDRSNALFIPLVLFALPQVALAMSAAELYQGLLLFMYGGVGFFGAIALYYFFGGFIVYLVRLGQEYRQVGLYHMLHGIRILFYVLCAAIVIKLLE